MSGIDAAGDLVFETPRIAVRTWTGEDVGLVAALHSSLETTRYLSGGAPWSQEKSAERLQSWITEYRQHGLTKFKLLARQTNRFIGRAGFSYFPATDGYELGYSLCHDAWGQGYATEIAQAMTHWFFEEKFARGFTAFAHPDNAASIHVMKKIGMLGSTPIVVDGIECPRFEMSAATRPPAF